MYNQKIANIFDIIQDHSRLGFENKLLENKSGRILLRSTGLLYKFLPTNQGVFKPTFYNFYTSHLRWNSTTYRPRTECSISQFVKTNCTQSIFRTINRGQFSETVQKISKITHTASWLSFLWCELSVSSSVWMTFNKVTLQLNNEFIIIIFGFLMVSGITMCNLIKRLIRATFFSTPASDVHERWKQTARTSD